MDVNKRRELIAEYAEGPSLIKAFLAQAPKEAVSYRPKMADMWTMAEHVHHLLDAEINSYVRYRFAIAEPGGTVKLWNQEGWKERLGYSEQDTATVLETFTLIRSIVHRHLARIANEDWSKYTFVHPERGTLDLDAWLTMLVGHVKAHLDYLERNLKLYNEKQ